jgi:hypothetical protein
MQTKRNLCAKLAGVTAVLTLLSACQTTSFGTAEHIDFRAERFEDLRVVADFNDCKNDGLDLDRAAEESKDFSLHLAVPKSCYPVITSWVTEPVWSIQSRI